MSEEVATIQVGDRVFSQAEPEIRGNVVTIIDNEVEIVLNDGWHSWVMHEDLRIDTTVAWTCPHCGSARVSDMTEDEVPWCGSCNTETPWTRLWYLEKFKVHLRPLMPVETKLELRALVA